ncbi:unnamed protein product [Symbiodinium pilosum]|uniref:Uncharacterized protein n=1 Tax=Symbiodinium pilosum TaxID=2952 RepID=A0A812IWY5_SYMPI|nr:unnamed protein product [Symbiodinium pilosum]
MSGPLGGHQGYTKTFGPAGRGKKRFVTKGFKLGSYVIIKYKLGHETFIEYEGKIVDKRVGSEDKESYVELKDCLTLNSDGKILAIDKLKRLTDSFIEECRFAEKRETTPQVEVAQEDGAAQADPEADEAATGMMMPGMMPMMPGMMMPPMMMPPAMMPGVMPMMPGVVPMLPMMMPAMAVANQGDQVQSQGNSGSRSRSRSRG